MAFNNELISRLIDEGYSEFNYRGELSSTYRKKVYETIGIKSSEAEIPAHFFQAKLEIICASKVSELWDSNESVTICANKFIKLCEKCLKGHLSHEILRERKYNFYSQADSLFEEDPQPLISAYAGFACISAANAVLSGMDFDTLGIPEVDVDEPNSWTASFYASTAYCGSAIWEEKTNDDPRRREFWEWFLCEAIPSICQP